MASRWMCVCAAWGSGAKHGHNASQLLETTLICSKHWKHFSPSGGRALGTRHAVCNSRSTSGLCFAPVLRKCWKGFHCNCHLAKQEPRGLLKLLTPHTVPVHPPTGTFLSPQTVSPRLALAIPLPKMHRASDYVMGGLLEFCCSNMISVKQKPWRSYPGEDTSLPANARDTENSIAGFVLFVIISYERNIHIWNVK